MDHGERLDRTEELPVVGASAGWYPDPSHPSVVRYWDGAEWTAHVRPNDAGAASRSRRSVAATVAIAVSITLGVIGLAGLVFTLILVHAMNDWAENK